MIETVSEHFYKYGFFIKIMIDNDDISQDWAIAEKLKMSEDEYQQSLIKNYNGHIEQIGTREEVYFNNEEDALNAIEWVNSIIIVNKMCKGD